MESRSSHSGQSHSRPRYPLLSKPSTGSQSTSSSTFTSTSSIPATESSTHLHTQYSSSTAANPMAQGAFSAVPLPSPSNQQPDSNYFGHLAPQVGGHTHNGSSTQRSVPVNHQPTAFVGQRGDGGGAPVTTPFLQDFNLVAEAAKRAQMACLARDLGDVGL